ncbi:MAG: Cell division inhibitor, partial [uncultured Solirubrobacteraceae bacterium]
VPAHAPPPPRAAPRRDPGAGVRLLRRGEEPGGDHAAAAALRGDHARPDRHARGHADRIPAARTPRPRSLAHLDPSVGAAPSFRRHAAQGPLCALASRPPLRARRAAAHGDDRHRLLRARVRSTGGARAPPLRRPRRRADLRAPRPGHRPAAGRGRPGPDGL